MDIQRKAFEESNNVNPDWSFKFDEELQQYVAVDFEMTNQVDEFNEHWDTFRAGWDAKAQAVPEGFVLVPERNVHDHYIANHLKGTTCSVDVSELTGNDGDRIYGKLRSFDCLGSDGNTLIYDLESSNFNLVKTTGNTGDFVLVPKEPTLEMCHRGRNTRSFKVQDIYKAMIEAQEQSHD